MRVAGTRIAVTGALGRAGRHIVRALNGAGRADGQYRYHAIGKPVLHALPDRGPDAVWRCRRQPPGLRCHRAFRRQSHGPTWTFSPVRTAMPITQSARSTSFRLPPNSSIDRVVWASSETVQGFPYDKVYPERLPICGGRCPDAAMRLCPVQDHLRAACPAIWRRSTERQFWGCRLAHILYEENGDYDAASGVLGGSRDAPEYPLEIRRYSRCGERHPRRLRGGPSRRACLQHRCGRYRAAGPARGRSSAKRVSQRPKSRPIWAQVPNPGRI